jgi:biopolymer transport protein ExbD
MAMNTGSGKGAQAVINVTPMIDILLVLLIVFMAIAPQRSEGLEAFAPPSASGAAAAAPESAVVLAIAEDATYSLNSEPVTPTELTNRLTEIYSRRSAKVLFIKGAPELEFGTVASAIDLARNANVAQVALMPR